MLWKILPFLLPGIFAFLSAGESTATCSFVWIFVTKSAFLFPKNLPIFYILPIDLVDFGRVVSPTDVFIPLAELFLGWVTSSIYLVQSFWCASNLEARGPWSPYFWGSRIIWAFFIVLAMEYRLWDWALRLFFLYLRTRFSPWWAGIDPLGDSSL